VSSKANVEPLAVKLPDHLPPVEGQAARALLDLVEALAEVELDERAALRGVRTEPRS
jgi:hypothetical protein